MLRAVARRVEGRALDHLDTAAKTYQHAGGNQHQHCQESDVKEQQRPLPTKRMADEQRGEQVYRQRRQGQHQPGYRRIRPLTDRKGIDNQRSETRERQLERRH